MNKAQSDSFILELPLQVNPCEEKILLTRFMMAKSLYNACLGEALARLKRLRAAVDGKKKFSAALKKEHCFSEYDLHKFAIETKNRCAIGDHLDTHVCQKIAKRAFDAVEKYAYGKRGRPRFKSQIDSVER